MFFNIEQEASLQPGDLQSALEGTFSGIQRREVVVAYADRRSRSVALLAPVGESIDTVSRHVQLGCLTKLLTATALERAIAARALSRDGEVAAYLPGAGKSLSEVSIRHLTDHTHGLNDGTRKTVPLKRGFIDAGLLISEYVDRLSHPGEIYSYSNAGARLVGAILEAIYGAPYWEVLKTEVFNPVGINPAMYERRQVVGSGDLCPARGGGLVLHIDALLSFLESAASREQFWPELDDLSSVTPIPGWNPFERGVFRGWKCYGDAWFGHSAVTEDNRTALVRVCPERRIVLVVASVYHHANMVAARLFGKALPGFRSLRIPKPLLHDALRQLDQRAYCGVYRNAAEDFTITYINKELRLTTLHYEVELTIAENNILLPKQSAQARMGFVQLLTPNGNRFRYLWDGQRVYRNVADRYAGM